MLQVKNQFVFSYDKISLKFWAICRLFLAVFMEKFPKIRYLSYVRRGIGNKFTLSMTNYDTDKDNKTTLKRKPGISLTVTWDKSSPRNQVTKMSQPLFRIPQLMCQRWGNRFDPASDQIEEIPSDSLQRNKYSLMNLSLNICRSS